jgi:NitT/TauT family transport system substrate-binding protein
MSKFKIITLVSIIVILIIASFLWFIKPQENKSQKPTFKLGYQNVIQSLPIFLAQEKGWLDNPNWKIELVKMESSNQVNDALLSNQIDLTSQMSIYPPLLTQINNPNKTQIFATSDLTSDNPFDSIVTKSNSKIQNLSDLSGKKIGVFPGVTATNQLKALFKKQNIDFSKNEFVQLAPNLQLQALANGSIEAMHLYEPIVTTALQSTDYKKIFGSVYAEVFDHSPAAVWVLSTKAKESHPQEIKEITQMLQKSYNYTKSNELESRKIAQKAFSLDEKVAQKVPLGQTVFNDQIDPNRVQGYADLLFEFGELKQKVETKDMIYKE